MDDVVVVNENDEVIGTAPREIAHKEGIPHRIAVVYVYNSAGQILVQTRMSGRLDHSAAGHLDPGETYLEAARRELKEELNISGVELTPIGHCWSDAKSPDGKQHHVHVFETFKCLAEPGKLQKEEVRNVYWEDPRRLYEEMVKNPKDDKFAGAFYDSLKVYMKSIE